MRCYKCGGVLGSGSVCSDCGTDVKYYKRIIYLSNIHYNEGLKKAGVRDLSGARESLVKSLKYNKRNVASRNLLGLVYYETGHISEAIVEWIVSSNIQPDDNIATEYVNYFQKHKDELERMNAVITGYNKSLEFLKGGSEDLALLHLKKILGDEPKLLEAYQLMALLCLKNRQYTNARKYLKTALAIDQENSTSLEYERMLRQKEGIKITERVRTEVAEASDTAEERQNRFSYSYKRGNDIIIQPKAGSRIRDVAKAATSGRTGGILLIIVAIIWFLLIPSHVKKLNSEANDAIRDYNLQMQLDEDSRNDLEAELNEYKAQEEEAALNDEADLGLVESYEALLTLQRAFMADEYDSVETITTLKKIDKSKLSESGQTTYENLWNNLYETAIGNIYDKGIDNEEWGEFEAAAGYFEQVLDLDETYNDSGAIYHAGFCYENLGNKMKARSYYEKMISEHGASSFAWKAQEQLNGLNSSGNTEGEEEEQ